VLQGVAVRCQRRFPDGIAFRGKTMSRGGGDVLISPGRPFSAWAMNSLQDLDGVAHLSDEILHLAEKPFCIGRVVTARQEVGDQQLLPSDQFLACPYDFS
jgi:hypothetical protein